jgi:hypothetical protein
VRVFDTPFVTLAETEHALLGLRQQFGDLTDTTIATHEIRSGDAPHYAFGVDGPDVIDDNLVAQGCFLLDDDEYGRGVTAQVTALDRGRAVVFPGSAGLVGTLTVGEVLQRSAIERVKALGVGDLPADEILHTREFVRPRWYGRELVLDVLPHAASGYAPFEVPNPTPCCEGHS